METEYCNCPETQWTDEKGKIHHMPKQQYAGARHDCAYARARTLLVPEAMECANRLVPGGHAMGASDLKTSNWAFEFNTAMDRLARPLLQDAEPTSLQRGKASPTNESSLFIALR